LLHFESRESHIDRHTAQKKAYKYLECKPKKLTIAAQEVLVERFDVALERASKLDVKHKADGSPPMWNPSSSIGNLVEQIRSSGAS